MPANTRLPLLNQSVLNLMISSAFDEFVSHWKSSIAQGEFVSLTLADPLNRVRDVPVKQSVRAVNIRDDVLYQWEWRLNRKSKHKNLSADDSIAEFEQLFAKVYREAYLFTTTGDFTIRQAKKGAVIKSKPPSRSESGAPQPHNRPKNHIIREGTPCPFLETLGVMTSSGKVKASRQKKFRQINRYLELINDIYTQLPDQGPLHVIDFGCGLSYLTFALHHLLANIHGREVSITGIDQNPEIIQRCIQTATSLNLAGLRFSSRPISEAVEDSRLDLAISLHACDTATDDALTISVQRDAQVILAAPCCQHELNPLLNNPALECITKHGILRERFASMATDALRVAALEAVGYHTQILEFIDLEHTPKNLLIRAVKANESGSSVAYDEFKSYLGLSTIAVDRITK